MSTDLMAGLAAGFGYAADRVTENAKTKLEEKLEKDREDRAHQRKKEQDARKEEIERLKVVGKQREQSPEGVWREKTNSN